MTSSIFRKRNGSFRALRLATTGFAFLSVVAPQALAQQNQQGDADDFKWERGAIAHAQKMRAYPDVDHGGQLTPAVIPQYGVDFDPSGLIATAEPSGPTQTSQNAFFKSLGSNDRTCFTCHQPQNDWSVSAAGVQARFYASYGTDPIFRLVDGAVCPTADVSTPDAKRQAYSLLLSKGLIRIPLPMPANAEFSIVSIDDPYNCNTNPATGLTSPTTGIVSVYRRPLSATNLGVLATIMWDGREPSLASQATNATLGHAQAGSAPTPAQVAEIVNFEAGLFTAQIFDHKAKALNALGATGGPALIEQVVSNFYIGVNDAFGGNPRGVPFTNQIFDLYKSWENLPSNGEAAEARASIARGEKLFNNTPLSITGVGGLNDLTGIPVIPGFCGSCHDTPDAGSLSLNFLANIGVASAQLRSFASLDAAGLPTFTLRCNSGPRSGNVYAVTDPGRALISGKCEDIGKFKTATLRGLAGRAPYFHNGSAATLKDVVLFYNQRFGMGFSDQDIEDLTAFLKTL